MQRWTASISQRSPYGKICRQTLRSTRHMIWSCCRLGKLHKEKICNTFPLVYTWLDHFLKLQSEVVIEFPSSPVLQLVSWQMLTLRLSYNWWVGIFYFMKYISSTTNKTRSNVHWHSHFLSFSTAVMHTLFWRVNSHCCKCQSMPLNQCTAAWKYCHCKKSTQTCGFLSASPT